MAVSTEHEEDTTTEPLISAAGWRMTGERPFTPEETGALESIARRYGRCAVFSGACTMIAFVVWFVGMATAAGMIGTPSRFLFCVIAFGPMILMGLAIVWLRESVGRLKSLRRDLRRGTAVQFEGTVRWSVGYANVERRLLREGLLQQVPGRRQTVEILPDAHILWRANGNAPTRVRFEAMPISLPPWQDTRPAAPPVRSRASARQWFRLCVAWLGSIASWYLIGGLTVRSVALPGPLLIRCVLGAGIALVGTVAVVGGHEAGHLIAGWLVGMRFVFCQVGPITLSRTVSGLRFGWCGLRQYNSGLACMTAGSERQFRRRDAWMVAAGPITSLILALALYWASSRLWLPARNPSMGNGALQVFAFIALIHVLASSTPMTDRASGLTTDAGLLRWLWTDTEGVNHIAAASVLASRIIDGQRPRNWDADLLARGSVDPWGGASPWGSRMLFYHHLEAGRLDDAWSALGMASSMNDVPSLRLEAAFYNGLFTRDAVAARENWEAAGDQEADPDAPRAKAAVLLAEGDRDGARSSAEKALKNLSREIGAGIAAAKEDWIRRILAECDSASASAPAVPSQPR